MSKTTAPETTPSPTRGSSRSTDKVGAGSAPSNKNRSPKADFYVAVLNMSWQLAIVVLVPIVGGFKLDELLNITPALTIVGFIVAMTGMGLVVWRQLQIFTPAIPPKAREKHS